jgi:hypothetical protein
MAQDPRETWQRLQRTLQESGQKFGKGAGGGGNPRAALSGILGLALLGGGAMLFQASIFNGKIVQPQRIMSANILLQWMVVIGQSSTPGSVALAKISIVRVSDTS